MHHTISKCSRQYAWRKLGRKLLDDSSVVGTIVPMNNTHDQNPNGLFYVLQVGNKCRCGHLLEAHTKHGCHAYPCDCDSYRAGRDYRAEYADRNHRAQAAGFRSYAEQRKLAR